MRVKFKDNLPVTVEPFITGWLDGKDAWGRPVDVAVGTDGALYVSDDSTGYIYRVVYSQ
jgi:glucose/arabinose dehydrogenase